MDGVGGVESSVVTLLLLSAVFVVYITSKSNHAQFLLADQVGSWGRS